MVRPPLLTKPIATLGVLAALAVAGPAAAAVDAGASVQFTTLPDRAVQGGLVTVSISVSPSRARCRLSVRYANGARQKGLPTRRAANGRATWRWRVSRATAAGPATATVSCAGAGSASRSILVVGSIIPAKISVEKKGFSIRTSQYTGSNVSYGLVLHNHSPNRDALDVSVLVNFVMPDNRLIGSASMTLPEIPAGTSFANGNDITFPGIPPIERLEIVIQVGRQEPASRRKPAVANVRILPSVFDAAWVGSVEGEIVNDDPRVLERAWLSTVVFDKDGNVLGGGSGFAFNSLPPAARQFIKLSNGLGAIRFEKAASAMVSVAPTYRRQ